MSLIEQQNFLARLYTDEKLRRNFFAEPEKIGAQNDLTAAEIAEIAEIAPQELDFFAESLFWKRLREAEKFTPFTKKALGAEFQNLFQKFSQTYNPRTVKKHLEDAFEFCKFLQNQEINDFSRSVAAFEKAKLEIYGYGKRFAFCRLRFDVQAFFGGAKVENIKPQRKYAVWLKIGGKIKHFYI